MGLQNYCLRLPEQRRAELRKEFENLTGLYVPDNADAFDGFCLGRSTPAEPECETCEGTGFVDGPGDGPSIH